jgi:serine/threonine protein phosphatase PrpC
MEDALEDSETTTIIEQPHPIHWNSAALTDVGRVRRVNEDNLIVRPEVGLWAVADGAGGESAGDQASRFVVEALATIGIPKTAPDFLIEVRDNLMGVNRLLRLEAATRGGDRLIASTVVVLLAFGGHFACAWAGDSRLYLLRNGRLRQISRDHSEVQELVDAGLISPEAARVHPRANVVTRAVGAEDGLALEMVQDQVRHGDLFVLCSDGLTKLAEDAEILPLLAVRPIEAAARALVDLALARGGSDNVTVVLAEASAGDH